MAATVYNRAKLRMLDGTLNIDTDTIKILLIGGTVSIDPDHDDVAAVLAAMAELSITGYTSGVGSASRKTVAVTCAVDDGNNRATATTDATSWTGLGPSGTTIKAFLIYEHVSGADDALNFPIAVSDDASGLPLTTNGSDVSLAAQVIRLT